VTTIQPINEWFGIEPVLRPSAKPYTREQRQKVKDDMVTYKDMPVDPITPDEEWFRHHNWKDKRQRIRAALAAACATPSALEAWDNCGSCCQVEFSKELNRYRIVGSYCHSRHCEPCMKAKAACIIANLRARLKGIKAGQYHFITLTLAHDKTVPLKSQIERLYASYKKLRQTDEWIYGQSNADKIQTATQGNPAKGIKPIKRKLALEHTPKKGQIGGCATLEVKWSVKNGWHAHLHIISEGSAFTNHRLKDLWYQITGDSWECDCKSLSAEKDVAYYVGKYVTKGTNDEVWDSHEAAIEWIKSIKGVRMCATFGSWRGYRLLQREKEVPGRWTFIASLASICRRARTGDEWAILILMDSLENLQYDPHRKRARKPDTPAIVSIV
jgi:hypothetical protein